MPFKPSPKGYSGYLPPEMRLTCASASSPPESEPRGYSGRVSISLTPRARQGVSQAYLLWMNLLKLVAQTTALDFLSTRQILKAQNPHRSLTVHRFISLAAQRSNPLRLKELKSLLWLSRWYNGRSQRIEDCLQ